MPAPAPISQPSSRKESANQPIARVTTTRDVKPPSQEQDTVLAQAVQQQVQLEKQLPAATPTSQGSIDIRGKNDQGFGITIRKSSSQPAAEAAPKKALSSEPEDVPAPAPTPISSGAGGPSRTGSNPAPQAANMAPPRQSAPSSGPFEPIPSATSTGPGQASTPNTPSAAATPQTQGAPAAAGGGADEPQKKKAAQPQSEEELARQQKDEEDSNFGFILFVVLLPATIFFDFFCMIPLVSETIGQLGLVSLRGLFWLINIRPGRLIENLIKRILEQQSKGSGGPSVPLPKETGKLIRVTFEAVFAGLIGVRFIPVASEFSFATTVFLIVTFGLCKIEERAIKTAKQALKAAGTVGRVVSKLPVGPQAKLVGGALAAADDVVNKGTPAAQAVGQEMSGAVPGSSAVSKGGGLPPSTAEGGFAPGADASRAMAGTQGAPEQTGPLAGGKPMYTGQEEASRAATGLGRQPGDNERAERRTALEKKRSGATGRSGGGSSGDAVQADLASQFDEKKFTVVKEDGSSSEIHWSASGRPSAEGAPRVGEDDKDSG